MPYLLRIPRMNELKAEMLYDAGYDSLEKLQAADKDDLKNVPGLGSKTIDEIMKYVADGGFQRCSVCSEVRTRGHRQGPELPGLRHLACASRRWRRNRKRRRSRGCRTATAT